MEIGSGLIVQTTEHEFSDPSKPLTKQGGRTQPIKIKSDVYLGARVILLSGVEIGSRVVVGAGAIVTKSLNEPGVYVGTPARLVKKHA